MLVLFSCCSASLPAHTTYLRPLTYEVKAGESLDILVYNGTFEESMQAVPVSVIAEIKGLGPSERYAVSKEQWQSREPGSSAWQQWNKLKSRLGGKDLRRTSTIAWTSQEPGYHTIGVEVKPARIAMDEKKFHEYLEEVGMENEPIHELKPDDPEGFIVEAYIKTAKTIIRNGDPASDPSGKPLGLSSEIVPLQNPSELEIGDTLTAMVLVRGKPVPDQVVLAATANKDHKAYRSDAKGAVRIPITDSGEWWIAFNRMQALAAEHEYDLLSHWTTLTFEVE